MRLKLQSSVRKKNKKKKNRKNKQKPYYSGKKKRHTIKTQLVVQKSNKKIICTDFATGKKHDFRLLKESGVIFTKNQQVLVDTGYMGFQKLHKNSLMPKKRSKKNPLTPEDKAINREISRKRIVVENVIGSLKRFKIISDKYRNRRKRFSLRFNLISGIHKHEI